MGHLTVAPVKRYQTQMYETVGPVAFRWPSGKIRQKELGLTEMLHTVQVVHLDL